ncbi:MAG: hypothetical protein Q9187_001718 [Circinaria calcarea]
MTIAVEFTGGLEMLFANQRKHDVTMPSKSDNGRPADIGFLVRFLCDHVMKGHRKDMFLLDGAVRPGILVLINDADWELEGGENYQIQQGDNILFVSTLHGG